MPVGYESMVLTAIAQKQCRLARGQSPAVFMTDASRLLAKAVCEITSATLLDRLAPIAKSSLAESSSKRPSGEFRVRRDDKVGQKWFTTPEQIFDRDLGFIGLSPFQGVEQDTGRFDQSYYILSSAKGDIGAARVVYDRIDARARVLGLRSPDHSLGTILLNGLVQHLEKAVKNAPLTTLVCIRADVPDIHAKIEASGFFPTAYFPGMILVMDERRDVIQYTRLTGRSLSESTRMVTALEWPQARTVIEEVVRSVSRILRNSRFSARRAFFGCRPQVENGI